MYNIIVRLNNQEMIISTDKDKWEEIVDYVFGHIEVLPACGNCSREVERIGDRCERCKNL